MNILKWAGFVMALIASQNVLSAGYVGDGSVHFMQNAFGGWILSTNGGENPDQCANNTIILETTHQQYDEIYSFLLVTYTSGKQVNIHVNGCNAEGYKKLDFVFSAWN